MGIRPEVRLAALLVVILGGCHHAPRTSIDVLGDAAADKAGDAGPDGGSPEAPADLAPATSVDAAAEASVESAPDVAPEAGPDAAPDAPGDATDADASGPAHLRALSISVGQYHMCTLLEDHRVKCWGYNRNGELGLGDARDRGLTAAEMGDALPAVDLGTGRTAKAVSAGTYGSCAILDTDDLKCWGLDQRTGVPAGAATGMGRGDEPGEMGDALPIVNLGAGRKAKRIAVGYYGTCAQRDDDSLVCWRGATSLTTFPARAGHAVVDLQADLFALVLYDDGKAFDLWSGGFDLEPPFGKPGPEVAVAGSFVSRCAAFESGGLGCSPTRTGLQAATGRFLGLALAESSGQSCGLRPDGRVSCFGFGTGAVEWSNAVDEDGGLLINLDQPARAVAGGGEFAGCALLADGGVKCWPWGSKQPDDIPWISAGSIPDGTYKGRWLAIDFGTRPAR